MNDWNNFTDKNGNFQLANFLYRMINDLMKHSLDMGTLLSSDSQKLRAYKEQTKKLFKSKWYELAEILEFFEIIEKCACNNNKNETFCDICKGARYRVTDFLTSDEINETGVFINAKDNFEIAEKLRKTLMKALEEFY
jgi:hypothetical protein